MNICNRMYIYQCLVLGTTLVVSQMEVVFQGVAHYEDTQGQMPQWLARGVVAVEVLGLVSADESGGLHGSCVALWERFVELDNVADSLGVWSSS